MNAECKFNFQSGEVLVRLDLAILATGIGVPHCQEVLSVLSNPHVGTHQGAVE